MKDDDLATAPSDAYRLVILEKLSNIQHRIETLDKNVAGERKQFDDRMEALNERTRALETKSSVWTILASIATAITLIALALLTYALNK